MLGHRTMTAQDYMNILKKRWWMIALPVVVLTVVGYGITLFVPPEYVSQTLVLIEQQKVPDTYVPPVVTEDLNARLASMKEQITSRSRLQPIVEHYNLYGAQKISMDDRIDLVRKDVEIRLIHSQIAGAGGLPGFFILFKAGDPRTAQQVCGEIESLFVTENLRSRTQSAEGTTDFLRGQLADAKRNLDQQDAKLADFQRTYAGKLPGEEEANMNMLNSLAGQLDADAEALTRLNQNKTYVEAMIAQQSRDLDTVGEQPISPEAQNSELAALQAQEADLTSRYTSDYPDVVAVKRKIQELRDQIAKGPAPAPASSTPAPARREPLNVVQMRLSLKSIEQSMEDKKREQAQLNARIAQYQGRLQSSPMVQEEYKTLTRDYQTAQAFYDSLLKNVNQSKMATDLEMRQQGEQFKVMDPPNLPEGPVFRSATCSWAVDSAPAC